MLLLLPVRTSPWNTRPFSVNQNSATKSHTIRIFISSPPLYSAIFPGQLTPAGRFPSGPSPPWSTGARFRRTSVTPEPEPRSVTPSARRPQAHIPDRKSSLEGGKLTDTSAEWDIYSFWQNPLNRRRKMNLKLPELSLGGITTLTRTNLFFGTPPLHTQPKSSKS